MVCTREIALAAEPAEEPPGSEHVAGLAREPSGDEWAPAELAVGAESMLEA
jgi:hypothetical protein